MRPAPRFRGCAGVRQRRLKGCRASQVRYASVIDRRLQALTRATPRPTAAGVSAPTARRVHARGGQRHVTWHALAACDHALAQHAQSPPDAPVFDALPGAGAVLAPRRLAACGEPRDRDTSAAARHQYAGSAPVTARRGTPAWVPWRLQGPPFRRPTCVEGAAESIRHACGAQADDQQQRTEGASHQAAVRARAGQWSRRR